MGKRIKIRRRGRERSRDRKEDWITPLGTAPISDFFLRWPALSRVRQYGV
jgi:hypothetical protein